MGQLRYIDSAQFLLASLDKLVAANRPEAFKITAQYEPNKAIRKLIMHKGVYAYENMDACVRFEETQLPTKEAFYSKLSGENIKEANYATGAADLLVQDQETDKSKQAQTEQTYEKH